MVIIILAPGVNYPLNILLVFFFFLCNVGLEFPQLKGRKVVYFSERTATWCISAMALLLLMTVCLHCVIV